MIFLMTIMLLLIVCCTAFVTQSRIMSVRHTSTELNWGHHAAAEAGDIEGVVEFLAKDPKQISDYDIDGQTMLHFAAKNGHVELARYLIEQGPGFVNFKNIRYRTPLYWATYKAGEVEGCEEIAIMLVRAGADPSIKSKDERDSWANAKEADDDGVTSGFYDRLKAAMEGVKITPLAIGCKRVYWG